MIFVSFIVYTRYGLRQRPILCVAGLNVYSYSICLYNVLAYYTYSVFAMMKFTCTRKLCSVFRNTRSALLLYVVNYIIIYGIRLIVWKRTTPDGRCKRKSWCCYGDGGDGHVTVGSYIIIILHVNFVRLVARRRHNDWRDSLFCAGPNSRARETVTTRAMEMAMAMTIMTRWRWRQRVYII